MDGSAQSIRDLPPGGLARNSFFTAVGRLCDLLAPRSIGRVGLVVQSSGPNTPLVWRDLGDTVCSLRPVHDLGEILLRPLAERTDVLCANESPCPNPAERVQGPIVYKRVF